MSDTTGSPEFEKWWRSTPFEEKFTAKEYAFAAWQAAMATPANAVEAPKIQHVLSRDQRDALVAANVFLAVMQAADENLFNRIQMISDEISDMLYDA